MPNGIRIHHLNAAVFQGLRVGGRHLVCHVLVVETPSSGLVLVDSGLGSDDYRDIAARLGTEFAHVFARPKVDPSLAVLDQIEAAGFDRADVRHIVLTHLDLDHTGGLSDFPKAKVHVHAAELAAAVARKGFRARGRYKPEMWAHAPDFRTYSEDGERWLGFETVRKLEGLTDDIFMVPLVGHTLGHCGVAVESDRGLLLHAGDAYFDNREVHGPDYGCDPRLSLFQKMMAENDSRRRENQERLRRLVASHPDVEVFSAHDPKGLPSDFGIRR